MNNLNVLRSTLANNIISEKDSAALKGGCYRKRSYSCWSYNTCNTTTTTNNTCGGSTTPTPPPPPTQDTNS